MMTYLLALKLDHLDVLSFRLCLTGPRRYLFWKHWGKSQLLSQNPKATKSCHVVNNVRFEALLPVRFPQEIS